METNKSELYSAEEQEDDFQTDSDAIYGNVVSENNSDGHGEVSENDSDDQGDDEVENHDNHYEHLQAYEDDGHESDVQNDDPKSDDDDDDDD